MGDERVDEVLMFIEKFKDAKDVFMNGCCYWFSFILKKRFDGKGWIVDIFHDPIEGHFVARFIEDITYSLVSIIRDMEANVYFFDIRGNVTGLYDEDNLENIEVMKREEERRYGRLMCACKYMLKPKDWPVWLQD